MSVTKYRYSHLQNCGIYLKAVIVLDAKIEVYKKGKTYRII